MNFDAFKPTPCQIIQILGVDVVIKRDDLNHDIVQGNKLRKLKYNILKAKQENAGAVVTFGGAYSNHLIATAFAAKESGLNAIGFVRGHELAEHTSNWSDTLNRCHRYGMQLIFLTRSEYRLKEKSQQVLNVVSSLKRPYVIPEGGSNRLALRGMAEMIEELSWQVKEQPTHIICPVGTGGTLAGLVQGVNKQQWHCKVLGVAVLKGLQDIKKQLKQWLGSDEKLPEYQVLDQYDGGGYAKNSQELIGFGIAFEQKTGIQLDKIYNTKSFYALAQLIKSGEITANDRPMIINTGGLQGGVNTAKDYNK